MCISACQDQIPTANDPSLVPITPITVEVRLTADEFISDVQVVGGFGLVSALPDSALAIANGHTSQNLEARTIIRFPGYPEAATVRDSTGATVTDSTLTYLDGEVSIVLDTLGTVFSDSLRLGYGALAQNWDPRTANWEFAIDSLGNRVPWQEPGAGPVSSLGSVTWRPAESADTLKLPIDSLTIAEWADTTDPARGLRIEALSGATRVRMRAFALRVRAIPSANPDTVISVAVPISPFARLESRTFIYQPGPMPDSTVLRVGGAPAFRSYFRMSVPTELTGPPSLCAQVTCPLELTPELVNSAQILLRTARSPDAFLPEDTVLLRPQEVREPERAPRAPLGSILAFPDVELRPSAFGDQAGMEIEVPFTVFVQRLLAGPVEGEPDPSDGVVLLSPAEPSSLGFATFAGPGSVDGPVLRMILTVGDRVGFR